MLQSSSSCGRLICPGVERTSTYGLEEAIRLGATLIEIEIQTRLNQRDTIQQRRLRRRRSASCRREKTDRREKHRQEHKSKLPVAGSTAAVPLRIKTTIEREAIWRKQVRVKGITMQVVTYCGMDLRFRRDWDAWLHVCSYIELSYVCTCLLR
jgi:hypothetical protein